MLIRGARQVGKSSAVRQLGKEFKYFVEINLESQPSIRGLFPKDIDVHRTCEWRKRSIPTHSGWLYPLTFDAGKGLKEA